MKFNSIYQSPVKKPTLLYGATPFLSALSSYASIIADSIRQRMFDRVLSKFDTYHFFQGAIKMAKFYAVKNELIGAFRLLSEQIERSNSFEEIAKIIGDFFEEISRINNPKNNRRNKQIDSIRTFFRNHRQDKRSQEAVVEKSIRKIRKKKPSYKDFSEQIVVWREQGHSYPQICRLLKAQTNIAVSDQTIARFFKRRNNAQNITNK